MPGRNKEPDRLPTILTSDDIELETVSGALPGSHHHHCVRTFLVDKYLYAAQIARIFFRMKGELQSPILTADDRDEETALVVCPMPPPSTIDVGPPCYLGSSSRREPAHRPAYAMRTQAFRDFAQ